MKNKTTVMMILMLFIVTVSMSLFSGCTDTIDGNVNANLKPIVQFVNIPPEGQQFSRNPEILWVGNDPDGLIDYYRYHIAVEEVVNAAGGPVAYSATIADSDWTQIDVVQTESDPHTSNVLPLTADTLNPVANPIGQYVFLQVFDMENLGSDINFRLFNRNDNPPDTRIFDIANQIPYVNSVFSGGIVTGIRLKWEGSDKKDYDDLGITPPPFDFEWKLFGPFTDSLIDSINSTLIEDVFVTEDAQILHLNDSLIFCQTIKVDTVLDSLIDTTSIVIEVEICDTTIFDSAFFADFTSSARFSKEQILNVDDSLISSKLVTSSFNGVDEWIQNTTDTIYNVYKADAPDTTVELNFIFWIRSRDDALVKDLTPSFVTFPVINPRYERDVAVIDFTPRVSITNNHESYRHIDTAKSFWNNIIHRWGDSAGLNIVFDTTAFTIKEDSILFNKTGIDYIRASLYTSGIPLEYLLKHKVLILYNENYKSSGFVGSGQVNFPEILSAMDAGINVWAAWRNPLFVFDGDPKPQIIIAPPDYTHYFGVVSMTYSSWFANAVITEIPPEDAPRNEDFIGTYSMDESVWPSLAIDTALLHARLNWHEIGASFAAPYIKWEDSLAALPEVNWAARSFGTEIMYLYKSKYGATNPVNGLEYEGAPVGHRLQSNLFRSVHFNFTLLTLDSLQAQGIANKVLDWLYDPSLNSSVVEETRYKDAIDQISIEEARQLYDERLIKQAERRLESNK